MKTSVLTMHPYFAIAAARSHVASLPLVVHAAHVSLPLYFVLDSATVLSFVYYISYREISFLPSPKKRILVFF